MTHPSSSICAPCIVGAGIIANRTDIQRLLCDLGQVQYFDVLEGEIGAKGVGYIMEVFADPNSATVAIGRTLYINVQSFDYLKVSTSLEDRVIFDLVRDSRILRLVPTHVEGEFDPVSMQDFNALEAAVADILAASLDAHLDNCESWQALDFLNRRRDIC